MDVLSIIYQPNSTNQPVPTCVFSAYRPIYFAVLADSVVTPDQPMYADIYFGTLFYKTISSYTINNFGGFGGFYEFDIQDACQEALSTYIMSLPLSGFQKTNPRPEGPWSMLDCLVYFRGSDITSGILTPNPVVPIQGTATTDPVAGTGTPCYGFRVINCTIDPYFASGTISPVNIVSNPFYLYTAARQVSFPLMLPNTQVLPLSKLPLNFYGTTLLGDITLSPVVYADDYFGFPILIERFGTSGILDPFSRNCKLIVFHAPDAGAGSTVTTTTISSTTAVITDGTYYLPCGPADLIALAPTLEAAFLTPNCNIYYRIGLYDIGASHFEFISPMYKVQNKAIEKTQLLFQNSFGQFESVSFVRSSTTHKTASSEQFNPYIANALTVTGNVHQATEARDNMGHKRYNIRSMDEVALTVTVTEALMPWLRDLLDSPLILERVPTSGVNHRAVTLIDEPQMIRRSVGQGRLNYEVTIKVRPSLDYITLRN